MKYLALILLVISTAQAEDWYFDIKNDFLDKKGKDRFMTNSFEIGYGDFRFYNVMFTPTDKRNEDFPEGDRPWDGETYLEYEIKKEVGHGEYNILRPRIGAVGKASGSQALQQFIHDDLGAGAHPTYAGQNPSELLIGAVLARQTKDYLQSSWGNTSLIGEYGIELITSRVSVYIDQEYRKHFFKYLYPYFGIKGEGVAYDTHLDGRIMHSNYYTVKREPFVATFRAGAEVYFPSSGWFVDFHYEKKTDSFKSQDDYHDYFGLRFGQKF